MHIVTRLTEISMGLHAFVLLYWNKWNNFVSNIYNNYWIIKWKIKDKTFYDHLLSIHWKYLHWIRTWVVDSIYMALPDFRIFYETISDAAGRSWCWVCVRRGWRRRGSVKAWGSLRTSSTDRPEGERLLNILAVRNFFIWNKKYIYYFVQSHWSKKYMLFA